MSEPYARTKIPIETLMDEAYTWWESKLDHEKQNMYLELYMKAKNIGPEEVQY